MILKQTFKLFFFLYFSLYKVIVFFSLRILLKLSKQLKQRRIDAGALLLASSEVRFNVDSETADPIDVQVEFLYPCLKEVVSLPVCLHRKISIIFETIWFTIKVRLLNFLRDWLHFR